MQLSEFNSLDAPAAISCIEGCCASQSWAAGLVFKRPYQTADELNLASAQVWRALQEDDYLEAFDGHPKIGDPDSLKQRYAGTHAMASNEQSGVNGAPENIIQELASLNHEYEEKFGFIFIVCASGKTAEQMLELIQIRLLNSRAIELSNAADEQLKITTIRLAALFGSQS